METRQGWICQPVLTILMFLCLSVTVHATGFNLTKTGVMLPDPEKALTAQTAIQLAASHQPEQHQKEIRSATNWLVAELHNPTEVTDWVANIHNSSTIDYIDFYVFEGNRMLSHHSDGRLAAARRQVFSVESAFALPFRLLPGETRQLVIRTETTTYRNTTVIAQPASEYRKISARNAVFTLMASGSIATFISYSLFLAWQLRDLNYLLYSLHAFAHLGFIIIVYGYFVGVVPYLAGMFGYKELFLNSTVPIQY
ncbi:MAG: 7TM-DISM domain-containing protein, partial [Methylococcaceae bacterium]